MSKRTSRQPAAAPTVSAAEMHDALSTYVKAYCEAKKIEADTKLKIEELKRNANEAMKPHLAYLETTEKTISLYVTQNRADFCEPNPRKKEIYGGHKIGLETGKPAVTFIRIPETKTKQTEEGFIEALRGTEEFSMFVRTIDELDRAALIAERRKFANAQDSESALAEFDAGLAELGVKITQKESVVIDLNLPDEVTAE